MAAFLHSETKLQAFQVLSLLFLCALLTCTQRAQAIEAGTTILPTDVEPLPGRPAGRPFTRGLQTRLWQRLPAKMFLAGTCETTMRIETNPYQYPMKRTLMRQAVPIGTDFSQLSSQEQYTVLSDLAQVSAYDNIHRITPSGTVGWAVTPTTQVFANSFFLRDSVIHNYPLNTNTGAIGLGAQKIINIGSKLSFQPQVIARELWQSQQMPVLDYLPGLTAQYTATNNLTFFANALLQVRFAHFVSSYMRELDPFYTWGLAYQKGNWTFSATSTFVQNFRQPFKYALVRQDNYSFVCDFEIDRALISKYPGLVTVLRAEPVYNFHSNATPGLAGMDFRLYYGFRLQFAKPALSETINQLRQRYLRTGAPSAPSNTSSATPDPQIIRNAIALDCASEQSEETMPSVALAMHGELAADESVAKESIAEASSAAKSNADESHFSANKSFEDLKAAISPAANKQLEHAN